MIGKNNTNEKLSLNIKTKNSYFLRRIHYSQYDIVMTILIYYTNILLILKTYIIISVGNKYKFTIFSQCHNTCIYSMEPSGIKVRKITDTRLIAQYEQMD